MGGAVSKVCSAVLSLLMTVLTSAAWAQKPNMQDGMWEITTRMEMPGLPAGLGTQTAKHCVTPAEAADPARTLPRDDQCQVSDVRFQGNTTSWSMRCSGPEPMTGKGSVTYHGTSYNGSMSLAMSQGGQTINVTQKIDAKRVGDCK